jgi:F-type H+-transporting ATPase subunit a
MINIGLLFLQAGNAAVQAAAAPAAQASEDGAPKIQNIVSWASEYFHLPWLEQWVNIIFSFAIMLAIFAFFAGAARAMRKNPEESRRHPGLKQSFVEVAVGGLDNFVTDILGKEGRFYTPLIGTLFIYILVMNLWGLVPIIGHSPTSSLNVTLSLALFIFVTVQLHGIRRLGILGYIKHFADLPEKPNAIQWAMVPLMFPLHLIGELAKPVSLSLRLFGNITGEDALIAIFVILVAFVPLQFFMYPLVLIGSAIQALVFASLSTVYILMMSPHEETH